MYKIKILREEKKGNNLICNFLVILCCISYQVVSYSFVTPWTVAC